jgi:hypothetical protein
MLFCAGYYAHHLTFAPPAIEITQERIVYQSVARDYNISPDECKKALQAYDTATPRLEITSLDGNRIRADAGLCERSWSRMATIRASPPGHIIQAGISAQYIGDGFYPGGSLAYLHRLGPVYAGGGVFGCQKTAGLEGLVMMSF